jgi:2-polyprenyl-3-methyl-5-hydroxy-6-metoxy-1,4-benzoquinol methylase
VSPERSGRCPVCKAPGRVLRAFAARRAERLQLVCCLSCGCEYLWPQPSDAWLAEEYAGYGATRRSQVERPKRHFFKSLLRELELDLSGARVVDVGAAEGDLLHVIEDRWPDAATVAVESNPLFRARYEALRCRLHEQTVEAWLAEAREADFDFAFLFDVLEHVRDPRTVVTSLVARLRPGGTLVASFPSASSLSRRLLGRHWPQYKVEHLGYFSAAAVTHLEEAGGLERLALRPLRKRLPLDYLLSVGAGTGPAATRRVSRVLRKGVPSGLGRARVTLGLGESLWIARRRALDGSDA